MSAELKEKIVELKRQREYYRTCKASMLEVITESFVSSDIEQAMDDLVRVNLDERANEEELNRLVTELTDLHILENQFRPTPAPIQTPLAEIDLSVDDDSPIDQSYLDTRCQGVSHRSKQAVCQGVNLCSNGQTNVNAARSGHQNAFTSSTNPFHTNTSTTTNPQGFAHTVQSGHEVVSAPQGQMNAAQAGRVGHVSDSHGSKHAAISEQVNACFPRHQIELPSDQGSTHVIQSPQPHQPRRHSGQDQ